MPAPKIRSSDITPERLYLARREIIRGGALAAGGLAVALAACKRRAPEVAATPTGAVLPNVKPGPFATDEPRTPFGDIPLKFGLPATAEEERRLYDQMDFQRATQAYIWAIPFVAMGEWKNAHLHQIGAAENETVLYNSFKDKLGILTANLTTPYLITFGSVAKEPVVVEIPAGNTAGMVMDFWQRPMTDLGQAGPDKGRGGKYLLVGPGQTAPKANGYGIVPMKTNNFFAGIYYVQCAPKANFTRFYDPRAQADVMMPPPVKQNAFNGNLVQVEGKPGRLVLFPAWLKHDVPINTSARERITVSFNLMFPHFTERMSMPLWQGGKDKRLRF